MLTRLLRWVAGERVEPHSRDDAAAPALAAEQRDEGAATALREAVARLARGEQDAAEALLREAIALKHDLAEAHCHLGAIHDSRGEREEALDCYQLAAHFDPGEARAHYALAGLHKAQGRHAEAVAHYRQILEHHPNDAAAYCNLCFALYNLDDYAQALANGERALAIDPAMAEAHHNVGLVLRMVGESAKAARHFTRALELKPHAAIAAGLAHAYRDLGRLDDALDTYDRALSLAPGFGDAVSNRAYTYLMQGNFERGWAEYEKRFVSSSTAVRDFGLPRWAGEPLEGKTVLVHAEQGIGDEIMFASCLPDLMAIADRVVIECNGRLEGLFRRSFARATVHGGRKDDPADWLAGLAPIHYQVPIGSLPRFFRAGRETFRSAGPYLHADQQRVRDWRKRLGAEGRPVIGLSWRGGTPKTHSHLRSVPLALLAPALRPGFTFVSLQHGVAAAELQGPAAAIRSYPGLTDELDELAALMGALDLIISVDNTNVHLAGALGRPVLALLSASPEWRYGVSAETMPWYPSVRLLRRRQAEGWEPVVERLVAWLDAWPRPQGPAAERS